MFPGLSTVWNDACGFCWFFLYFSIHTSVVVMVTMTAERYLVLTFPLKAARWFTVTRAKVTVAVEVAFVFCLDVQHIILR
jgi:hypothetical protein